MKRLRLYLYFLCLVLAVSCAEEKDFPKAKQYPLLKTTSVVADSVSVIAKGEIVLQGKKEITEYGFIYETLTTKPKVSFKKVLDLPAKSGPFMAEIKENILKGVDYEIYAYAIVDKYKVDGDKFTFKGGSTLVPVITDFEPKQGFDGTLITITGENFIPVKDFIKAKIGNANATVIDVSSNKIIIKAPDVSYVGSFPITLTIYNNQVTTSQKYTILGPTISGVSESTVRPGEELTLYGEHLDQPTIPGQEVVVLLDRYKATVKSRTDKEIVITVPSVPEYLYFNPLSITVTGWNKPIALTNVVTVEPPNNTSGFRLASFAPSNLGLLYARMPNFVSEDRAHLFTLDHFVNYNIELNLWSRSSSFTGEGRSNGIVALVGREAYVIGGRTTSKSFNEVWAYHYPTDTWSKKSSLPFTVYGATSFVLDNMIYFFGGNNSTNNNTLWRYDPQTGNVVALNNFPAVTTETGSTFTIDNKVYVVTSGSIYQYNPQQDTWTRTGNVPLNSFAFTVENQGYIVSANTKILSRYDVAASNWVDISTYPSCVANSAFTGFGYKNRLYLASFACSANLYYQELQ
ncbi:IPT/TIG domain-containing protein [Pontibacter sp. Tf4]|uniref:IPT/TIG domain-containing protein n=1 Tax=Pontibacter sp. Tf4 TaxID=2761620 RepID=UPI001626D0D1|nr:IPT/TIG domain-containing protein [Pontibacter sp. Tf4]MBB6612848.1 IPT/TIG domain-containing protein [Pontibacter sp. Tf4]